MWRRFTLKQIDDPPPAQEESESDSKGDVEMKNSGDEKGEKSITSDKKQEEPKQSSNKGESDSGAEDSIHCTDEEEDEVDYGDDTKNPKDENRGDQLLPRNRPISSYDDQFMGEISWYFHAGHFINELGPNFVFLPADQRDRNNQNHGLDGIQFFKLWDHVGTRDDDLKGYNEYKQVVNTALIHLRDNPHTWHMQVAPTAFNSLTCP